jgi:hypothetical protein
MPSRWAIGVKTSRVSLAKRLLAFGLEGLEGPHVMEPVGEFDENDPDVFGHA